MSLGCGDTTWICPTLEDRARALEMQNRFKPVRFLSFAFMAVHVTRRELDCNLAVEHRREVFSGRSYADFAFHPVLTGSPSERTIATVGEAIDDGTPTVKLFTTDLTTRYVELNMGE